jgi:hypothetical protein
MFSLLSSAHFDHFFTIRLYRILTADFTDEADIFKHQLEHSIGISGLKRTGWQLFGLPAVNLLAYHAIRLR